MKNLRFVFLFLLTLTFCGCSAVPNVITIPSPAETETPEPSPTKKLEALFNQSVETLKGWSFQYNDTTDDYSIFFGLLDKKDNYISANTTVDVRIVNDNDEEVYSATLYASEDNFAYYTSQVAGTRFLANIKIPAADIAAGNASSGTVFLTVYNPDYFYFNEVNCTAFNCLPIKDLQVTFDSFPLDIDIKGYDGGTEATIQITDASYEFEKDYTPKLKITVSGEKTYGNSGYSYDDIAYKLYNSEGYLIDNGYIFLDSLSTGDKFRESVTIYNVTPGETYTLKFMAADW